MVVNKDTNIYQLLEVYPELEAVLENHGLTCVGCPGAERETLEEAAQGHATDLEKLLNDIKKEIDG